MTRVSRWAGAIAVLIAAAGPAEAQKEYRVSIDSDPSGATVYLGLPEDGEELGQTPFDGTLPAGEHILTFVLEGYSSSTREFNVRKKRKRQKFTAELEELVTGIVSVTAPTGDLAIGAEVRIDGNKVGIVPDDFDVEVGPHVVEIVATGLDPYEEWIEVVEGETVSLEPELGGAAEETHEEPEHDDGPSTTVHRKVTPREVGAIGSAMLVVDTALDFGGRHYSYSGQQSNNLRPYDADGVPLLHVGGELYPLAGNRMELLRSFGIVGSFDRAVSLASTTSDGTEVDTTWQQLEVGARGRTEVGDSSIVGATVSYGKVEVAFDSPDLMDETPEVQYRFIALEVDGRYGEGRVAYFGGGSFLLVSSAGTAADRFRDASTFGLGLHGGVAVGIVPKVEARLVGRYRMFSSTFTSEPTDPHFAAGATDHIYGIMVGAAFIY